MPETIAVKPELIRWAIDRSRLPDDELTRTFPKLVDWRSGERMPTIAQLEKFARKTMTPLRYFFLDAPPDETLPIPDFRTVGDTPIGRPSPNLIETIQVMLRRQAWTRESIIDDGQRPLPYSDLGGMRSSTTRHARGRLANAPFRPYCGLFATALLRARQPPVIDRIH
ncbi:MAG: hypothetical protein EXS09_22220 [Gemmataceae bacterium]|nr:hypothetical protein [Gemmataceae bacterium]